MHSVYLCGCRVNYLNKRTRERRKDTSVQAKSPIPGLHSGSLAGHVYAEKKLVMRRVVGLM